MKHALITALAVLTAAPAGITAQEPAPAPRPPRAARTPRPELAPRAYAFSSSEHGRIGVVVNTAADADADKLGARIEAVTPGGPAEKAGLAVGDIITKFNGTALAGLKAEDDDESGPGMKLVELAHALDPGDTVKIEYRHGDAAKSTTLVAQDLGGGSYSITIPRISVDPTPMVGPMMGDMPGMNFNFSFGDSWNDMELVTMNPDLGDYFGTRDGILVVKAAADSTFPLKAGDVILAIGGRKPTSPSHAMRILRSYEVGETVQLDVMRKQKRISVTWTVPKPETTWRRQPRAQREHQPDEQGMPSAMEEMRSELQQRLRQSLESQRADMRRWQGHLREMARHAAMASI